MKKIIFLIIPFILLAFSLHKFHLSNTKVVYNEKDKAVQITMRCFVDDIEKTIDESNNISLELGNERQLKNADKFLKEYLLDNFSISINNKDKSINYIGNEVEKDIVFFYFEINNISHVSSIKVVNKILLNTFDDQQNVVRLEINDKKKTIVLKNGNYINESQL